MIQFAKVGSYRIKNILVILFYVLLNLIKIRSFDPLPLKLLLKDLTKPLFIHMSIWPIRRQLMPQHNNVIMHAWIMQHDRKVTRFNLYMGFRYKSFSSNLRDLILIRLCSAPFRLIYTENGMPHINYTVWLNKMQILENVQSYSLFMMIQLKSFIKINIISYIMQYISDNQEI